MPTESRTQPGHQIRVMIVDDHDMLREGLITFIAAFPELELVGETSSAREAIELCAARKPDVILMDLIMPDMDGVTAIEQIHRLFPSIRIIALSSFSEETLVRSALRAGAISYLLKNISAENLAEAIRVAHRGLPTLAPEIARQLLVEPAPMPAVLADLTPREKEVLALMIEGLSNAEIAIRMAISRFTVKNHVSSILSKLGATSRTEAVSQALQKNIVH